MVTVKGGAMPLADVREFLSRLTWRELVHTSYFRFDGVAKIVAFQVRMHRSRLEMVVDNE